MHTILILGGYGFFGSRICEALVQNKNIHLLIGGRHLLKAQLLIRKLGLTTNQAVLIDANAPNLVESLHQLKVNTVIHTAGPFQGQNYHVAHAAIAAGANYIDLADGRDFVAGIKELDILARQKGVFVTSGASSLPALSSAVVDRYLKQFSKLESIHHGISSGARSPGLATIKGVFSYCGKPFKRWELGNWKTVYGWLNLQAYPFPKPIGTRLLGNCDVPDLVLFPHRYPDVHTVTFQAGFASNLGHRIVWCISHLIRLKWIRSMQPLAAALHTLSLWICPLVSDKGAMFVSLKGVGHDGQPLNLTWHLIAAQNHGPYIPCGASIALAHKLSNGETLPHGAMPCMGLITVEEYLTALHNFNVVELKP
jgi:saccharopine dehydrogenase-like NADP-dependent oxidoreductase